MKLLLERDVLGAHFTLGKLFIDGEFECFTCEDFDRRLERGNAKVDGETAIPRGTYEVVITRSQRFGVPLPLVSGIPGFSGVRIHPGNSHLDTEGCILPGRTRSVATGTVALSRIAFEDVYAAIKAVLEKGEKVTLEVR